MKLLVTSYKNPDLDGTACAFAYSEFLNKNSKDAMAALFGTPHREALFVLDRFSIPPLSNAEDIINDTEEIILVDASDLRGLSKKILAEKVVEIIDHRKVHDAHKFPNAKKQIELVGSAATLIAEKFHGKKTEISQKSAALLFSAIISNTINFKAGVTTKRDHEMADWLRGKFSLPKNYVHEMFADKSQFKKPLKETFIDDFAEFNFNGHHLSIIQIEIINASEFIQQNITEIKEILRGLKRKKSLDIIFLTCIDLENAFNKFVVVDEEAQRLIEQVLGVKFEDGVARRDGIIMRKEIIPLIKEVLENR
jgi:manganese-dependent inorganic pyrophosphatase